MIMKLLLLLLLLLLIVTIESRYNKYIKDHDILLNHMRNHATSNIWHEYNDTFDKGIVTCAGNFMVPRVVAIIYVLRDLWKSKLPIAVFHCGEIDSRNKELLNLAEPNIYILDLCQEPILGMSLDVSRKRLRGFYCKVAAMIKSPFKHSMMMDLDVIWLQSPEKLFESKTYQSTGALYFRDRTFTESRSNLNIEYRNYEFLKKFQDFNITINQTSASTLANSNGFSLFWRAWLSNTHENKEFKYISDYQDSSVLLIDRTTHPKTIDLMQKMLPDFDCGYGDKEIFWIASTIANEPFTFEPFLSGQYGDCKGVILHYDPDDAEFFHERQPKPLYINGEFMVEKELFAVGDFIKNEVSLAVLVTPNVSVSDMWTWDRSHDEFNCTFNSHSVYRSTIVDPSINQKIMYSQWVVLSLGLSRQDPYNDCMPVVLQHYRAILSFIFESGNFPEDHCNFIGCPLLPLEIDSSLPWPSGRHAMICDPLYFNVSNVNKNLLKSLSIEARHPQSKFNLPFNLTSSEGMLIQCGTSDCENVFHLFILKNGSLHKFQTWSDFVNRGYDTDNVHKLAYRIFHNIPMGDLLPLKD